MSEPNKAPPVWWLTLVALAAAGFHQAMLLLPIALAIGLPVLFYGHVSIAAVALVGFLVLAWAVQPSWHLGVRIVPRAQAPLLYTQIDALADTLKAPRVHHIALDASLNAGAIERHRGLSLRPTRRVMVLGLPLLRLLDVDSAKAVIAHELGHFSRHHGRLGHWLYRTRQAWSDWARLDGYNDDRDSSPWERAGRAFGEMFLPWFRRQSEAHSRRCEFEADAIAARCAPPAALGRALLLTWLDTVEDRNGRSTLRERIRRDAAPPEDWSDWPAAAHPRVPPDWRDAQPAGETPATWNPSLACRAAGGHGVCRRTPGSAAHAVRPQCSGRVVGPAVGPTVSRPFAMG